MHDVTAKPMLKTMFGSIRPSVLKSITPLVERFRHSLSSFETLLHLKSFTNIITYKSARLFTAQLGKAGVCSLLLHCFHCSKQFCPLLTRVCTFVEVLDSKEVLMVFRNLEVDVSVCAVKAVILIVAIPWVL